MHVVGSHASQLINCCIAHVVAVRAKSLKTLVLFVAHTGRGNHRRSPVPRRRNTFITDVLSALSNKSTASTQYPPVSDVLPRTHLMPVSLKRNASVSTSDGVAQDVRKAEELVEKVFF